jgi:hypothetical protein
MPYFRERTFPGQRGRLRTAKLVETEQATYQSSAKRFHPDLAVRWSKSLGVFDVGVSHFYGTSREPTLLPRVDESEGTSLIPHYSLIHQTGVDLQATVGSWLWKA